MRLLEAQTNSSAEFRDERVSPRLFWVAVAIALVPVFVAALRAVLRDWIPVGDNAYLTLRARDVFSSHVPLLGTGSSASETAGTLLNHPGPLYFDVLALPVKLLGGGPGTAFGVALVNGLAIVGIAVVARRRVGPLLAAVAVAATAALCLTMGSELLFDPWQPHAVMLPFFLFLTLVWSATRADLAVLPWAAGVGSLIAQTHLSYAVLVPALGGWAALGLLVELRTRRRRQPELWPELRRRALRFGAIAGAVTMLCWLQPLVEQFTGEGTGNLTRLVQGAGDTASGTVGYARGLRVIASVVGLPPWWFRPSLEDAWHGSLNALAPATDRLPSLGLAVVALGLAIALLAWCAWDARRREDRDVMSAVLTALVGLMAGLATAQRIPLGPFGIGAHQMFWLWPLAAFTSFSIASTLLPRLMVVRTRVVSFAWVVMIAVAAVAAVNLVPSDPRSELAQPEWSVSAARELGRRMSVLDGKGPMLVDGVIAGFADPFGPAVMAELQRRRIPFVAAGPGLVRHLGPDRRFTGGNARAALFVRTGAAAQLPLPGARRVALRPALTPPEERELARLTVQISTYVRDGRVRLNARGRAAQRRGELPTLGRRSATGVDVAALVRSRELVRAGRGDLLAIDDPTWAARFDRYTELQRRSDTEAVALFLRPLE